MATGAVKWFDAEKGQGFIAQDGAQDVFVHSSAIDGEGQLKEGDRVEFEVKRGRDGRAQVGAVRKMD